MEKIKVNEVIIVEGRDDTAAVKQAADGLIIETHGFGIRRQTWELIEKAYSLAAAAHGEQKRRSGEPYIIHPPTER